MSRDHEESYETVRSERPLLPQMDHRKKEIAGVLWFTLLFVLAIGIANGAGNQHNYLLPGLKMADPEFLTGDWFTWGVEHSHRAFAVLVAGLAATGHFVVGLTVATALQHAAVAVAIYMTMRAVYERPMIPWAATLALFAALETTSVASAPLLLPQLEASSLAGAALAMGLACLAWRRILLAGVCFGLAGLTHAHYAVLALPIVVAATYVTLTSEEKPSRWNSSVAMWGAYLLVALPSLLDVARFASAPGGNEVHDLAVSLFPWHVAPWTWSRDPFVILCGAVLLGAGGMLLRPPRRNRQLAYALGAVLVTVFVSLAMGFGQFLDLTVRVWPWRLAPFVLVAGFAGVAAVISSRDPSVSVRTHPAKLGYGLLLAGFLAVARVSPEPTGHVLLAVCLLPIARWLSEAIPFIRTHRSGVVSDLFATVVVTMAFVPAVLQGLDRSRLEIRPQDPARSALYAWAETETPPGAVFALPPSWSDFRLNARRPVVADWKAVPRYPPDRLEWFERIRSLTDLQRPERSTSVLDSAYATMDCEGALRLRRRYATRFVVHERPKDLPCGREVYSDSLFRVWELPASDR